MIGTWLWERGLSRPGLGGTGEFLLEFRPDGTWQARYVGIAGPFDFGTFQFDGSWLELLSDPAVNGSPCASLSATYAVEFLDIDTLTMPPWDAVDECVERMNDLTKGNFLRVDEGSG
ncbi:MAG: hypothetical protein R3258_09200 [Acidimicrobiia bacterium]|nr:hypothetical protein [Acidimicrobiia bacterium]